MIPQSTSQPPCYGYEATTARERGLPLLAGVGVATTSLATSDDFVARRVLYFRFDVGWVPASTVTGIDALAGVAVGATCIEGFRPSPSSFAMVDRLSE